MGPGFPQDGRPKIGFAFSGDKFWHCPGGCKDIRGHIYANIKAEGSSKLARQALGNVSATVLFSCIATSGVSETRQCIQA